MKSTEELFKILFKECKEIFDKKMEDYGPSWQILRPTSITDQIYIKAGRIRSIEEKKEQKVSESIEESYIGIVNYSILYILSVVDKIREEQISEIYDNIAKCSTKLMSEKNHDYGEIWKDMRMSSYVDLILQKLQRIKQIEDKDGKALISEGTSAGYYDIINYSIFALIKLKKLI